MLTLFEFSQKITAYKKEKKFSEALAYFKENKSSFTKEQIGSNEYIIADMLFCLRQAHHLDAGFQFLNIYEIAINEQQKERVLSAYGWLLWAKYKAENQNINQAIEDDFFEEEENSTQQEFDLNKSELLKNIEHLIPILLLFDNPFASTIVANLFRIVLKSEKKKPAPNWRIINEFCNKIDREKLSKECATIQVRQKGSLKDMEMASDLENWYAYKTKALFKLGKWQECFDLSKEALEKIEKFHYSNDVWFARRVALSKKNMGDTEHAIQELQTILRKKREWFIQKELAELYLEKGHIDNALKYAIDAMNNFGPLEFKVDLLYLLGKILRQQEKSTLSWQHFLLAKLIRQSKEWKIPQKLLDELKTFSSSEVEQKDLSQLKKELQKYWNTFKTPQQKPSSKDMIAGEIAKILHDTERGKVGFVKSNNKEYYFSLNPNFHSIAQIIVGAKVMFEVLPPRDKKEKEQARIKKIVK